MDKNNNNDTTQTDYLKNQFDVLRFLYSKSSKEKEKIIDITTQFSIDEITEATPIGDDREVLRALYSLEGQKLVTPYPPGDFTSNNWCLTETGKDVAEKIVAGKTPQVQ